MEKHRSKQFSQRKKAKGPKALAVCLGLLAACLAGLYFGAKAVFPLQYETEIRAWSADYEVDPYLVMGIIRAESSFRTDAVSSAEAMGLMQITETTGKQVASWLELEDFRAEQLFDGACNIRLGTRYVQWLAEQFDGDVKNVLAAYNAGIGTVKGWLADSRYSSDGIHLETIPFRETADFVTRVMTYQSIYRILYRT